MISIIISNSISAINRFMQNVYSRTSSVNESVDEDESKEPSSSDPWALAN